METTESDNRLKDRKKTLAIFLSGMLGGLGQIYLGLWGRGCLFVLINLLLFVISITLIGTYLYAYFVHRDGNPVILWLGIILHLGFLFFTTYCLIDAKKLAELSPEKRRERYPGFGFIFFVNLILFLLVVLNGYFIYILW